MKRQKIEFMTFCKTMRCQGLLCDRHQRPRHEKAFRRRFFSEDQRLHRRRRRRRRLFQSHQQNRLLLQVITIITINSNHNNKMFPRRPLEFFHRVSRHHCRRLSHVKIISAKRRQCRCQLWHLRPFDRRQFQLWSQRQRPRLR